jgi:hypothetical protein
LVHSGGPYDTATVSDPVTLEYVADTIALPAATPITTPEGETVTSAVSELLQAARLVTSIVDPSDSVAVAVNCAAVPTAGAVPLTATELTELAAVGVLLFPHPVPNKARPTKSATVTNRFFMTITPIAALATHDWS